MKLCVLGNGLLAKNFEQMDFTTKTCDYSALDLTELDIFDTIINTYDYGRLDGEDDPLKVIECNVTMSEILSDYCESNGKRYVYLSDASVYKTDTGGQVSETAPLGASDVYSASKLLGESVCGKRSLIIRVSNMFNDQCTSENALYEALICSKPTKTEGSYTYTVDVIRGIVALLMKKKLGIYNISSTGWTSQSKICDQFNVEGVAPIQDTNDYYYLDCSKLHEVFVPSKTNKSMVCSFNTLGDIGE